MTERDPLKKAVLYSNHLIKTSKRQHHFFKGIKKPL